MKKSLWKRMTSGITAALLTFAYSVPEDSPLRLVEDGNKPQVNAAGITGFDLEEDKFTGLNPIDTYAKVRFLNQAGVSMEITLPDNTYYLLTEAQTDDGPVYKLDEIINEGTDIWGNANTMHSWSTKIVNSDENVTSVKGTVLKNANPASELSVEEAVTNIESL